MSFRVRCTNSEKVDTGMNEHAKFSGRFLSNYCDASGICVSLEKSLKLSIFHNEVF